MYKMHPFFWCQILGKKVLCTRDGTVLVLTCEPFTLILSEASLNCVNFQQVFLCTLVWFSPKQEFMCNLVGESDFSWPSYTATDTMLTTQQPAVCQQEQLQTIQMMGCLVLSNALYKPSKSASGFTKTNICTLRWKVEFLSHLTSAVWWTKRVLIKPKRIEAHSHPYQN